MTPLFDIKLRAARRDRAARTGAELFLLERAFEDCLDRLALVQQEFRNGLLIGCPDPAWPERLRAFVPKLQVLDPGGEFATAAGGEPIVEDSHPLPPGSYDLVVAMGTLDTVNDLPLALKSLRAAMDRPGFFIGAVIGGDSLPMLRAAMRAADQVVGEASAHVHPRIEASALAPLLAAAGFSIPVVDVDRVPVGYPSLAKLVGDLRAMGATNILNVRARRSLTRAEYRAAEAAFAEAGTGGRSIETFEILHFAAWVH